MTGIHTGKRTEDDLRYLCISPDPDDTTRALKVALRQRPGLRVFLPAPEHTA